MLQTRLVAGVTSGFVLGAIFATALTTATFGEAFIEPWRVDPARPAPITLRLPRLTVRTVDPEQGRQFPTVAETVARGTVVRDEPLATLVRIYERDRRPPRAAQLAAQWFVYFLLIGFLTTYLRRVSSKRGALLRTQVGFVVLATLFLTGVKALLLFTDVPALMMPVALIPLWGSMYIDRRTGLVLGLVMSLLCASLVDYEPIASVVFAASSASAAAYFRYRKRSALFLVAGLIAAACGASVYIATKEIFDGFFIDYELAATWRSGPAAAAIGGLAAGVLAFVLQPLVARALGFVSRGQLLNLTDLERPLLKKMAAEAPGSWEHSRAMANLAEAAAASIGADTLLTRTGAYYHDLGKTVQCKYFVENLDAGERSPHEDLDPHVSADAIMTHVVEGTRILRDGGVPEPVIEFAYTHHGTSVIEFFWHKCREQGNPKELTEDDFRYMGMVPRTKETAILMLIDSIEAGARTVDPPSREGFDELIQRVIFSKLKQGQLEESGLTIEDLRVMSNQITDTLINVYHSRIKYPWQEEKDAAAAAPSEPDLSKEPTAEPAASEPVDTDGDEHF